jgi:uncharacterized membrane protein YdjX (TVP38/TMEM64 family)
MIDGVAGGGAGRSGSAAARRHVMRFAPLAGLLLILVLLLATGVWRHISLDDLKDRRTVLEGFVRRHPVESVMLYMGIYCLVVAVSIPGALIMTLTGGFLFGTWLGGAAAIVGVSSGAVVMFLVAHTAVGNALREYAGPDGLIRKIEDGVRRNAFSYILFLRLMPAAPIWLVNIAAGFVKTPLWTYALATVLGIAPSCFIYASIGAGLDKVFAAGRTPSMRDILHLHVFLPLFALAALALLPIAYQRWRKQG